MTYSQFVALYTEHARRMSPAFRELIKLTARDRFMVWFRGGPRQTFDDLADRIKNAAMTA